ncbi:hypothetical protein QWY75_03195 [Pontixanthobacter aestiaquae]|uniref:Tetratricopeptide repeat-containing protein n=1 Tax=Pontixanthobacter aestiaquae TaxID=1509367 RepID=A0A844ZDC9_9SPHN|nr:hypothetical protein [Pontixanthobacter aestiaquae]MDN3645211.1 hypothetical protein [Pontixanthobacter aestiaquae]MXO83789.1 hypothetical protein [Pontixanthobacter aestiaquae]
MNKFNRLVLPLAVIGCAVIATPITAETLEELDALAEITQDEAAGIKLAQEQAGRGEFLEAIGTLERVLANHPKSQSARLLHAVYLCRIDDQAGGAAEVAKLKRKHFPEETWQQATTICTLSGEDN